MLHVLRQISMAPESADLGPHLVLALRWGSGLAAALCFSVWTARGLWRVARASRRAADPPRRRTRAG